MIKINNMSFKVKGLKAKVLLITLIPLVAVFLIISTMTIINKINSEKDLLLNRINAYRYLLESGDFSLKSAENKSKLESLYNEKVKFSKIIYSNYEVIYSSEPNKSDISADANFSDIQDAFNGVETTKTAVDSDSNKELFVYVSPLVVDNKIIAVLYQALYNEKSSERIRGYSFLIITFVIISLIIYFFLISVLLNNVVLKNIIKLKQATLKVQEGDLDTKTSVDSHDEIGDLSKMFDVMKESIKTQQKQLREYNKELEQKIKERTENLESINKKLADSNSSLERFNKLFVDRELKMIELKEQIKKMEEAAKK